MNNSPIPPQDAIPPPPHSEIALIGMGCVFPGAANMRQYWENILHKVDAVGEPPPGWEQELFWDPTSTENDRTYCKRGGYLGDLAEFDPFAYGVLPSAVDGCEPDHFMALRVAHDALADSGPTDITKCKERTAVILGRGTYVNRGNAAAMQQGVMIEATLRILKQLHPEHTAEELKIIKEHLRASAPQFQSDTASGLVPNIITGRIANRLDLMGPNYLVDAACASSLVAVQHGMQELQSGRCDLVLAGGVHANTSPVLVMIFSQLKALSRKGTMRPFDSAADGTLLGEGVGVVVLKRLAEAERDGDKIYAVLKGVGVASDGRAKGVLAPRIEGEITAIERAYQSAGIDPATVGLIEAHGTSTPVGDATECEALRKVFGTRRSESPRCALGSVKSMISHTMPASGMAGLIKSALALHHKVLPPTLHVENPNPKLGLEDSNFYLNTETRPWIHGFTSHPRRAGINAFGFGGINAHAILEEYTGPNQQAWQQHDWDSELFVMSAATREALVGEVRRVQSVVEGHAVLNLKDFAWSLNHKENFGVERLAIVAASREDLLTKLARALTKLADEKAKQLRDIEGIYWFRDKLADQGKIAFIFPGEGSQYQNMLADLAIHFPEVREVFDLMDRAFEKHPRGYLTSDVMFPPPLAGGKDRLWNMDSGAESVFASNQALYALLARFDIKPDAMVGHSTGEHSALLASETVQAKSESSLLAHIRGVYDVFERLSTTSGIPEAVLLAIAGADHKLLEDLVAKSNGELYIALDNCVHQVVICGKEDAIDRLMQALSGKAAIAQKLPFGRAYHTPWFEVFSKPLRTHFDHLSIGKPQVDLYSCVTTERYPDDPDAIRQLAAVQWASTVRFRETTDAMYRDGVRIFVEIGPKSNLSGFVDDVLRGKPHISIPSNVQHRSGILQLHHMLGQLIAHGVNPNLTPLYDRRDPKTFDAPVKPKRTMILRSGIQPIRLPEGFELPNRPPKRIETPEPAPVVSVNGGPKHHALPEHAPAPLPAMAAVASSPRAMVMEEHLRTMQHFLAAQQQFMTALVGGAAVATMPAPAPEPAHATKRPFITEVLDLVPGSHAIALHRFDLAKETVFWDHTLGRDVSVEDPSLLGLPVVPLTVTMEILAEAAALLEPNRVCTGMRDIRAARWVTIEQPGYTVELTAKHKAPGEIHVALREAGAGTREGARPALRPIFAEATVLFADSRPASGGPMPFALEQEHRSTWDPALLYRTGMFHGALMQGVKSVERAARNGASATLEALPHDILFEGNPRPAFVFDPILLDAAGQAVAYWFWEAIEKGTDLFPYRVASFDIFESSPPVGARLECRVLRRFESDMVIHSDIEVLDHSGKVYYRLKGWETRRFPQPPRFLHLRVSPREAYVSAPWPEAASGESVVCRRIDDLSTEFLESSHNIWLKALAYLALNPKERTEWEGMKGVAKRRHEWLLGRCAAKDAVRELIAKATGEVLCEADIEIGYDGHGKPEAHGAWEQRLNVLPQISITHSHGVAAAIATVQANQRVGIDIEVVGRAAENFEKIAFREEERGMLAGLPPDKHNEWALRLWTAKEALSKALGQGFHQGLHSLHITGFDLAKGTVEMELADALTALFPALKGKKLSAHTSIQGQLSVATAILTT
jgi:acyl transferase domain-containing protein/phosphopantetheinyl transferase